MKFWIYVLPLPLFAVTWALWFMRSSSHWFSCYVMLLPLLYGYIAPGIATNVLKKWRFHGSFLAGNYFIHHGVIFASNMSPLLFLVFGCHPFGTSAKVVEGAAMVIVAGALHGYVLWIHDVQMLRTGMVVISGPLARQGKSAEEIAFSYAPLCFFFLGVSYATAGVLAYNELVVKKSGNWMSMTWLLAVGLILMIALTSIAYGMAEKHSTHSEPTERG